ncbi:MAG: hypothetical protein N2202_03705 [Proteobacteria bacterium]|nr:hypothetical protein [Pseudomonadota bacterium]
MALIQNEEQAFRLAKAIVSDILLYNQDKVKTGIENDNLFEKLNAELDEGKKLFQSRVDKSIPISIFDRAVVDVLFKSSGRYDSKIW